MGKETNPKPIIEVVEKDDVMPIVEETKIIGVVTGCEKLYIREEPSPDASAICVVDKGHQLEIDIHLSRAGFYKVTTEFGADGYANRDFVKVD